MIIWRDDDIGQNTRANVLEAVDDVFQRHHKPHTIAVIASRMDERPDLVELIKARGMLPELHCWEHDDLTVDATARGDLERAVELMERLFGARPTVLYPPWNRANEKVVEAAARLGLEVSTAKVSLSQFLRFGGDVAEEVVNFHHWSVPDVALLERALALAERVK